MMSEEISVNDFLDSSFPGRSTPPELQPLTQQPAQLSIQQLTQPARQSCVHDVSFSVLPDSQRQPLPEPQPILASSQPESKKNNLLIALILVSVLSLILMWLSVVYLLKVDRTPAPADFSEKITAQLWQSDASLPLEKPYVYPSYSQVLWAGVR